MAGCFSGTPRAQQRSSRLQGYNLRVRWDSISQSLLPRLALPPRDMGLAALALALGLALSGCQKIRTTDLTPLDKAGMAFNDVEQLRRMDLSGAEVQQVAASRQAW